VRTAMAIEYSKERIIGLLIEFEHSRVRILHAWIWISKIPKLSDFDQLMRQPCISETPYMYRSSLPESEFLVVTAIIC
jgi:hypothetical protein